MSVAGLQPAVNRLGEAQRVLSLGADALKQLSYRLNSHFEQAVDILLANKGRVVVIGMGKSGHVGRKMAATFSSTGTPAYFLHPAEGSHGDVGLLTPSDVVIAISNSGETPEVISLLPVVKRLGLPIIAMTGQPASTLAQTADCLLDIAVLHEACPMNLAPTTSTTVTMALGDALAIVLMKEKGITETDFARVHPAGALGRRLLFRVQDLMHTENLPMVQPDTPFLSALLEVSEKRLGLALVVDADRQLLGILTDGDIRRVLTLGKPMDTVQVSDAMNRSPQTVRADALAVEALHQMQIRQITALVITQHYQPVGVLHLHDILKAGIY